MLKKLFAHSIIYGLAPQISKIAGIFALPIITKDLTELDYGIWGIIMAYVGSLQALSILGMGVVLSVSYYKMPSQHRWLWKQIYGFLSLWAVPYSLLTGLFIYFIIPNEAADNSLLIIMLVLLPNAIFGPTTLIGTFYYQLGQNPFPIAWRTALFGLITVALNIYTISYLKMGYMGWIWSAFIVSCLMNISYWIPLNFFLGYSPILNFKWRTILKSFDVAIPTIPHQYGSFLMNSSDRIVLDLLSVSTSNIGKYNLASQMGGYFQTLFNATVRAISPMMLSSYKKNRDFEARNLVFVFQIIGLFITFFFSLWMKEIFQLLVKNETLAGVYPLAIIIIMAGNYKPMYIGAINKLFYEEKTKLLWRISLTAGVLNVILNILLVPIYGFEISAYTTFICLMYMGFSGHFIKKIQEIHTITFFPIFWLILIVCLTALAYFLVEVSCLHKIFISTFSIFITTIAILRLKKNLYSELP